MNLTPFEIKNETSDTPGRAKDRTQRGAKSKALFYLRQILTLQRSGI